MNNAFFYRDELNSRDRIAPPLNAESPVSLFMMITNFETGGSERQFTVLAQNVDPSKFRLHLGCVSRRGPLGVDFPDVPEFRLGGSLYGWTSVGTRLNLRRPLRQNRVQVAQPL